MNPADENQDHGYRRESAEVFYAQQPVVTVSRGDIDFLKQQAQTAGRQRSRLCTHTTPDDTVHEMLIVHADDTYVRPHKHLDKAESFHLIDGRIDVVLFDEDGAVSRVVPMGDYSSGLRFYYRINEAVFHTLLIRSPVAVFHEVTAGPFVRDASMQAPWSPDGIDSAQAMAYRQEVESRVQKFIKDKSTNS